MKHDHWSASIWGPWEPWNPVDAERLRRAREFNRAWGDFKAGFRSDVFPGMVLVWVAFFATSVTVAITP